jgi:hypothetical protein
VFAIVSFSDGSKCSSCCKYFNLFCTFGKGTMLMKNLHSFSGQTSFFANLSQIKHESCLCKPAPFEPSYLMSVPYTISIPK